MDYETYYDLIETLIRRTKMNRRLATLMVTALHSEDRSKLIGIAMAAEAAGTITIMQYEIIQRTYDKLAREYEYADEREVITALINSL